MAIQWHLDLVLERKSIRLEELARSTSIDISQLRRISNGKSKEIKLVVLDVLCRELVCQPRDLLEYKRLR